MKRFEFTLERLLRVRQHQTDGAKSRLAAALLAAECRRTELRRATAALLACESGWAERSRSRALVMQWQTYNLLHETLVEGKRETTAALEQALAQVAARRAELAEVRRREKVLETLKEHQLAAWQQESLAVDQKETDEVAQNVRRPIRREAAMR